MDNVGRILKDRHISVNGLLALIHDRHPDCGLPYHSLRRLVSHERKMSIDEAILICDALDIPFTALFDFAGEVPHGPLKGMTSADIYRACDAAGTWHTIGNEPYARAELDEGLYSSRWQRASTPGRRYLTAMAEIGGDTPSSTSEIARRLGKTPGEVSMARDSLIKLGLIYSPEHGKVAFTVPDMGEFILRAAPSDGQAYDGRRSNVD